LAFLAVLDGRRPKNMDGPHVITISDKPAAQQPSSIPSWPQVLSKLIDYFLSNVIKTVGSLSLLVGGIFFLFYFGSIGFMPEIDLKTSIALLAASALTGSFLLIVVGGYLLAPSWIWVQATRNVESLKSPRWFALLEGSVLLSFTLSFFFIRPLILKWWWVIPLFVFLLPFLGIVRRLLLLLFRIKVLGKPYHKIQLGQILLKVGTFYYGFFFSVSLFAPPFLFAFTLGRANPAPGANLTLLTILGMTAIFGANIVLVADFSRARYFKISAFTLLMLILYLNAWTFFPRRIMNIYKFGDLPMASLVLDEIGCRIVKHHGLIVMPYTSDVITDIPSNPKTCSLSTVMIRSRLSGTFYLEVPRSNKDSLLFTIPGQNVLSWAVIESKEGM
jgi:hypothetical protein